MERRRLNSANALISRDLAVMERRMNGAHVARRKNGGAKASAEQEDRIVLRRKLDDKWAPGLQNYRSWHHLAAHHGEAEREKSQRTAFLSRSKFKVSRNIQSRAQLRGKADQLSHFSHRHPLVPFELEEEDGIICSGCELGIVGAAYGCLWCKFFLHKLCFDLPRELVHRCHPKHVLTLLPSPAYKDSGMFICNACGDDGSGFVYHCPTCKFDLHVDCAYLPKTLDSDHHQHPLTLFFQFPYRNEASIFFCDVCEVEVDKSRWVYYCLDCDYGAHVECATVEHEDEEEEEEEAHETEEDYSDEDSDSLISARERFGSLRI